MEKLFVLIILFSTSFSAVHAGKIDYWESQKRGANFFNAVERNSRMESAKKLGVSFIRLTPSKWKSNVVGAKQGEFLVGDLSDYQGLIEADFRTLKAHMDYAAKLDLKIVLTFLNVPGRIWSQHNDGKLDLRIWTNPKYRKQVAQFWSDLATRLKNHPSIVGYNLLNEPAPEKASGLNIDWYSKEYVDWCNSAKGTKLDISEFYSEIVSAIRTVDRDTPIILDTGSFGVVHGIQCLRPIQDQKTIYSFHAYEPYLYGLYNRKLEWKYKYPGKIPIGDEGKEILYWDRSQQEKFFEVAKSWQLKYGIPSNRVLVGEFGVLRRNQGADRFLKDLIGIFNQHQWHWAFYSYREDTWDGLDYELGSEKLPWKYWKAVEAGEDPFLARLPFYKENGIFKVIREALL